MSQHQTPDPNSPLPAFRQLQAFIAEQTARKPYKRSPCPKSETANSLTRRIVAYVRKNGGFASRLNSTGTYRADVKKFVASQQVLGIPDVFAVLDGRAILVEVKVGRDTLSDVQKRTHVALNDAGAWVYTAHSYEGFTAWFGTNFLTPPF